MRRSPTPHERKNPFFLGTLRNFPSIHTATPPMTQPNLTKFRFDSLSCELEWARSSVNGSKATFWSHRSHAKPARQSSLYLAAIADVPSFHNCSGAHLGFGDRRHHRDLHPDRCRDVAIVARVRSEPPVPRGR